MERCPSQRCRVLCICVGGRGSADHNAAPSLSCIFPCTRSSVCLSPRAPLRRAACTVPLRVDARTAPRTAARVRWSARFTRLATTPSAVCVTIARRARPYAWRAPDDRAASAMQQQQQQPQQQQRALQDADARAQSPATPRNVPEENLCEYCFGSGRSAGDRPSTPVCPAAASGLSRRTAQRLRDIITPAACVGVRLRPHPVVRGGTCVLRAS